MSDLPLVLHGVRPALTGCHPSRAEGLTVEDPLPAVLDVNAKGYVLAPRTRFTEVQRETTDDK